MIGSKVAPLARPIFSRKNSAVDFKLQPGCTVFSCERREEGPRVVNDIFLIWQLLSTSATMGARATICYCNQKSPFCSTTFTMLTPTQKPERPIYPFIHFFGRPRPRPLPLGPLALCRTRSRSTMSRKRSESGERGRTEREGTEKAEAMTEIILISRK